MQQRIMGERQQLLPWRCQKRRVRSFSPMRAIDERLCSQLGRPGGLMKWGRTRVKESENAAMVVA